MSVKSQGSAHKQPQETAICLDSSPVEDFFSVLLSRRWLLVSIVLISLMLGFWYAQSVRPVYQAKTIMIPVESAGGKGGIQALANNFSGLASLAGLSLKGGGTTLDKVIAVMESRRFTKKFIDANNLKKALFSEQWDNIANDWRAQEPSDWIAYIKFKKLRKIFVDNKTNLVRISIDWFDPEEAARWVNAFARQINEDIRDVELREARESIAFLKQQLESTQVAEMQHVLYGLIESQAQTIMLTDVRDEYALKTIDPAYVPEKPIKPRKLLIVVFSIVIGILVAILVILLLHFLKRRTLISKSS